MKVFIILLTLLVARPAYAFDAFKEVGIDPKPGAIVPLDRAFRDETGAAITLRRLSQAKPIVLVPVLHDCPNICGVTLSGLAQAIHAQSFRAGDNFTVIAFSIDPKETPKDAAAALDRLRRALPSLPASGWHALTGRDADIAAVTDALGYRYAWDDWLGQYAHAAATAVLTPDGRLARWLYGVAPAPTDLKLALTEAGQGTIGDWDDQLLLLCYHYDPQTGRYGSIIWTLLRIGGGFTVLAVAGLIGTSLLREWRSVKRGRS
jgi:protein SCO1/2